MNKKAPIVEIFQSVQGEGQSIGTPSVFVRFFGCNLRCTFQGVECDTPYAVVKDKNKAPLLSVENIIKKILEFKSKHIVWTGGEPTLYQNYIVDVMTKLHELDSYTCEIETNGTIPIVNELKSIINIFNISVKLKSSNQKTEVYDMLRINNIALNSFPVGNSNFKFVISKEKDINEVLELHYKYPLIPVYLMPEGITRNNIIANSEMVVELCLQYNFKFSPREQIIIWDILRGV